MASPLTSPSFLGYLTTQFFGAFNDNLFKQLMLLLAIPTVVVAVGDNVGGEGVEAASGVDLQGVATIVFGIPFVLFGGIAGYLADRYSKRRIIVLSKVGEIAVMTLGLFGFLFAPTIGFYGLWVVLFLMGLQSTFFGPGKYGILPEMLRREQLPRANGLVLMTTFIAIIIGTAVAGPLKDAVVSADVPRFEATQKLWVGSVVCIGIAIVGTAASFLIWPTPPAAPNLQLKREYLWIPKAMRTLLAADRPLLIALLASCVFWLIAGLTIQSVNSLGKTQLGLSDSQTSLMVSLISIGIAVGGVAAGFLTRSIGNNGVIKLGTWGTVLWCALLAITLPGGHLLGFYGSIPVLILLGASAAFFAIPIQVFLQDRPPEDLKGRMIAVMNQANFFAIVMSGVLYQVLNSFINAQNWPRSYLFAAMAVIFVPVALTYRMENNPADHASGS